MIKGNFERKTGVLLFYVEILHTRWFVLFRIINCVSDVGVGLSLPIYIRQPQGIAPTYAYTKKHLQV